MGEKSVDCLIDEIKRKFANSDVTAVQNTKQIDYILSKMMHSSTTKEKSSYSSDTDEDVQTINNGVQNTIGPKTIRDSSKESRSHYRKFKAKIHSYKEDKQRFDSYNVFNRSSLPTSRIEVQKEDETECNNLGKCDINQHSTTVESLQKVKNTNEIRGVETKKGSCKRAKTSKRSQKYSFAGLKKRPKSRKTVDEIQSQLRNYQSSQVEKEGLPLEEELNKNRIDDGSNERNDGGKPILEQQEDLLCQGDTKPTDETVDSAEEQKLAKEKLIEEVRNKEGTGRYWDSSVIFVDQGLAYNTMTKEKKLWTNRSGRTTSDINDPAVDAVILTDLAMGGLLVPEYPDDEYEFTCSFLDAMIQKYPILRQKALNEEGTTDYVGVLKHFAHIFPLLNTVRFIHSGSPLPQTLKKSNFGLPPVVFDQGFPCLACPHLLERTTNIMPFLVVGIFHRIADIFCARPDGVRLKMAWLVWEHLKKMVDSTALPWFWRESFCRRYGICSGLERNYLQQRSKAFNHLAFVMPKVDSFYRLFEEINDFDYTKDCPNANSLKILSSDVHYMSVFYNRALHNYQVCRENDKQNRDDTDDDDLESVDLPEDIERNLRRCEEDEIKEIASIRGQNQTRHFKKRCPNHLITNLEDEID